MNVRGRGATGEMARPKHEQPTPGELEILKILWEFGEPATVRRVAEVVNRKPGGPRAYTSVMSLMNVMAEKGLLRRSPSGRAFSYEPTRPREQTQRSLLGETLERIYDGSAGQLMAHLLDQSRPSSRELDEIRALLDAYEGRKKDEPREGGPGCEGRPPKSKRPRK